MIEIIFESVDFVAVDKAAGWLSIPGRTGRADLRPCLGVELEKKLGARLWPIHRLDFEVSGLVIFAKNAAAHRAANAWFENRQVKKYYDAWTSGMAPEGTATGWRFEWRSVILRGKRRAYRSNNGKEAITLATWLESREFDEQRVQCWQLEPQTGRSHQLRFELADHGCPILGDTLYGSNLIFTAGGIALRAVKLDLRQCDRATLEIPAELKIKGLSEYVECTERAC